MGILMGTIVAYEAKAIDAVSRYGALKDIHDVHVVLPAEDFGQQQRILRGYGFPFVFSLDRNASTCNAFLHDFTFNNAPFDYAHLWTLYADAAKLIRGDVYGPWVAPKTWGELRGDRERSRDVLEWIARQKGHLQNRLDGSLPRK